MEVWEPQGRSGCLLVEAEPTAHQLRSAGSLKNGETSGPGQAGTELGAGTGRHALPPRRSGSYGSDAHFLPRRTRRSALAGGAVGPGQGVAGRSLRSCGSPRPQCARTPAPASGRSLQLT